MHGYALEALGLELWGVRSCGDMGGFETKLRFVAPRSAFAKAEVPTRFVK